MENEIIKDELAHKDSKGGDSNPQVHAATGGGDNGNLQEPQPNVNSEQAVDNPVDNQGPRIAVNPGGTANPNPGEDPDYRGPRIAVNPAVFHDKRDALCVSLNEAFRILMELNGFEPQAEPTPAQRRFFADTAYANNELQLRRTILARICTFDTSIQ